MSSVLPADGAAGVRPASRDALELLRSDHEQTEELFAAYEKMVLQSAPVGTRLRLAELICAMVTVHDALETEIFYPAVRRGLADSLAIDVALADHVALRHLVGQIKTAKAERAGYDDLIAHLGQQLRAHVRFEERSIFDRLRRERLDLHHLDSVLGRWRQELLSSDRVPHR